MSHRLTGEEGFLCQIDGEAQMLKTDKQLLIEAQHEGMDWRDVLREALAMHRGKRNLVNLVAVEVGISHQTVYEYCRILEIDLRDYRH